MKVIYHNPTENRPFCSIQGMVNHRTSHCQRLIQPSTIESVSYHLFIAQIKTKMRMILAHLDDYSPQSDQKIFLFDSKTIMSLLL
jgi:hypothetical protein